MFSGGLQFLGARRGSSNESQGERRYEIENQENYRLTRDGCGIRNAYARAHSHAGGEFCEPVLCCEEY